MSSAPGEGSPVDFDFDSYEADRLPYYDPDQIAYQAVWPAVDELWGGDWLNEAETGHELKFPSSGVHDHIKLNVSLAAYSNLVERTGGDEPDVTCGVAVIQIEEQPEGAMRRIIINRAQELAPETIDTYKESALVAKKGILYAFDSGEEAEINAFQVVEDAQGNVIWNSDDYEGIEEADDYEDDIPMADVDRFDLQDIERIAVALSMLGAPERCLRALDIIKSQPVEIEEVEADE